MVSGSRALAMVKGRGVLLVFVSLVLVALLASPSSTLRASTNAIAAIAIDVVPAMPTGAASADHEDKSPCHHARVDDPGHAMPDAESAHEHGPSDDHASGTHHAASGCCAMSLCVGTCSSVCSGAGAGAVVSGTLMPSVPDSAELRPAGHATDVLPGAHGTPYRPPIGRPAIAG